MRTIDRLCIIGAVLGIIAVSLQSYYLLTVPLAHPSLIIFAYLYLAVIIPLLGYFVLDVTITLYKENQWKN